MLAPKTTNFNAPGLLAVGEKAKPKSKRPLIKVPESAEAAYNRSLQKVITQMNEDIKSDIIPEIKRLKPDYVTDAWPERIDAVLTRFSSKWVQWAFTEQARRIATVPVSMANAKNKQEFIKSSGISVGVEGIESLPSPLVDEVLSSAVATNKKFVNSVVSQYANDVTTLVLDNMRAGNLPTAITTALQKKSGITRRRAKNIARDQTAKLNGQLSKARSQDLGIEYFQWVTSGDSRVGDDHKRAANRDVGYGKGIYRWDDLPPEGKPGDAERPNCFPGDVSPNFIPGIRRLYRRKYFGDLIKVSTSSGQSIIATPNHPFLIDGKWVTANMLDVGDKLCGIDEKTIKIPQVKSYKTKPSLSDLFDSALLIFGKVSRSGQSGDFHGDGVIDQDVDIINVDRVVGLELKSMGIENSAHLDFAFAICRALGFVDGLSSGNLFGSGSLNAPDGIMSCAHSLKSLLSTHGRHRDNVCLAAASNLDPVFLEYSKNHTSRDIEVCGNLLSTNPSNIAFANSIIIKANLIVWGALFLQDWGYSSFLEGGSDDFTPLPKGKSDFMRGESLVVEVNHFSAESIGVDHVYNLETVKGWYNIDSITTKNCRCSSRIIFPWEINTKGKK